MRAKVVIFAMVAALAILAPVIYFHFKPDSPPAPEQPVTADNTGTAAPTPGVPSLLKRIQDRQPTALPARPVEPDSSAVDHETYVIQRKAQLSEMGMTDDPANLKTILSELENPDQRIRQAALTATIDFGSKDAIPNLQNEMNWATDPQEKVDIKKAIEFLELPRLGDDSDSVTQSTGSAAPAAN
jgi:hypothetical protein